MTTPSGPPITIGNVASELGLSLPLSLGDSRVLTLAGKGSAPISLSDLYNKTAGGGGGGGGGAALSAAIRFTGSSAGRLGSSIYFTNRSYAAAPAGGTPSYTYSWAITSASTGDAFIYGASNTVDVIIRVVGPALTQSDTITLQCTVTDAASATVAPTQSVTIAN